MQMLLYVGWALALCLEGLSSELQLVDNDMFPEFFL